MFQIGNLENSNYLISGINLVFCKNNTEIKNFLTSFYQKYEPIYNNFFTFFCKGIGNETNVIFKKDLQFDKNIIITDFKKIDSFINKTTFNKIIKNHNCILVFVKNIKNYQDFNSIYHNYKNNQYIFKHFFSESVYPFLNEEFYKVGIINKQHWLVKINQDIDKNILTNLFLTFKVISLEEDSSSIYSNNENDFILEINQLEFSFDNPIPEETFHESNLDFLFLEF
jgi:hypothetical protein